MEVIYRQTPPWETMNDPTLGLCKKVLEEKFTFVFFGLSANTKYTFKRSKKGGMEEGSPLKLQPQRPVIFLRGRLESG